jgi:hypothetical protein
MVVNQDGRVQTYIIIGGTGLGKSGRHLPHEAWANPAQKTARSKKSFPTDINFLKVMEGSIRRDFNDYPFVCLLRGIFMYGPEWQNDIDWLRGYDYKNDDIGIVRKFYFFLDDLYRYLDFWENLFQERGDDRFREAIDYYKKPIRDAQKIAFETTLVGVELSKAIAEDSCFFGIDEILRSKLWGTEPNPLILPFAAFFSPEMLLFYAIENDVFLYDTGLPCASLKLTLPTGFLDYIHSTLINQIP